MSRLSPILQTVSAAINSPYSDLETLLNRSELKTLSINEFAQIIYALLHSKHPQAQDFALKFYSNYDNPKKGSVAMTEAIAAFDDDRYYAQAKKMIGFLLAQKVSLRDNFVLANGLYRSSISFCQRPERRQELRNMVRLDLDIPANSLAKKCFDFFYYLRKKDSYKLKDIAEELQAAKVDIASLYSEEDLNYAEALAKYGDAATAKVVVDFKDIDQVERKFYKNGKEYDLESYALKYGNASIIEALIRAGYVDLEAFELRKNEMNNAAIAHLNLSKKLLEALKVLDVEQVEDLVNQGAAVNEVILQGFVKNFINQENFDENKFGYLLLLLVNNGANINKELIFKANPNADFLLAQVIENLKFGDNSEIGHSNLIIALNLVNCGARLQLSAAAKEKFIKIIIDKAPEYLEHFLELREINPDFALTSRLTGVKTPLLEYVRKNYPAKTDLINLIKGQQNIDQIARKKEKLLGSKLVMEDEIDVSASAAKTARDSMDSGVTTRAEQAGFFSISENERVKLFLKKPENGPEFLFGADLLRVAGGKKFAVKREVLRKDADGKYHTAIKWDASIAGRYALDDYVNIREDLPAKTKEAYANLAGCLAVVGEFDWNPKNILISEKTGRPVKIDNGLLVNGYCQDAIKHRIFGSVFSLDLLRVRFVDPKDREYFDYDKFEKNFELPDEQVAQAYNREYNRGINSELLEKIKRHISKPQNTHLKREFIAFMNGVQKMIDICEDKRFMDRYLEKYRELGQDAYEKAAIARRYFEENVAIARAQYKSYLEYYKRISGQISGVQKPKVTARFLGTVPQNKAAKPVARPNVMPVVIPVQKNPNIAANQPALAPVVKKRLIDIFAVQNALDAEKMQQLITKFGLPQNPINQKLLLEKAVERYEMSAILKLYEEIVKINPQFKEISNKSIQEMRARNMSGLQPKLNKFSNAINPRTLEVKPTVFVQPTKITEKKAPELRFPIYQPVLQPAVSVESLESGYESDGSSTVVDKPSNAIPFSLAKGLEDAKKSATTLLKPAIFSVDVLLSAINKIKPSAQIWNKLDSNIKVEVYKSLNLTVLEQKTVAAFTLSHPSQGNFLKLAGGIHEMSDKVKRQSLTALFTLGVENIESWAAQTKTAPNNVIKPENVRKMVINLQQTNGEQSSIA